MLNGTINLGKYTLLKMCALCKNEYILPVKQSEKKPQSILPDI